LIQLRDETIRIARPQCIGRDVVMRVDSRVTVYFPYCGEIMACEAKIVNSTVMFELNREKRIVGVEITRPTSLQKQQRRHDYRVTLARYDVRVALHEAGLEPDAELAFSAPLQARRMRGRMTNVSAAGFGVLVPKSECVPFKLWDLFFSRFHLPNMEKPLLLPAQIRHARRIHDGESVQIGFRIAHQDDPRIRNTFPLLRRFINAEQRRQLQAKKG